MKLFVWCIFFIVFKFGSGLLPEYCQFPANLSDCGKPATAIFSYYKPGSRCEIEIWRGCPTLNKFDDQHECSEHCVVQPSMDGISISEAHHIHWSQDYIEYGGDGAGVFGQLGKSKLIKGPGTPLPSKGSRESGGSGELNTLPPSCREDLNTSKCSAKSKLVYTYNSESGECYATKWYHCSPSNNKFNTAEDCVRLCLHAQVDWEYELSNLQKDEAEELDHAIEDAIEVFSEGYKDTADGEYNVGNNENKDDIVGDQHSKNGDPKDNADHHNDTQTIEIKKEATEIKKAIDDATSETSDNDNSQSQVSGEDRLGINEFILTQILFATTHKPLKPLKQIVYATSYAPRHVRHRTLKYSIRRRLLGLRRIPQFSHGYRW